MCGVFNFCQFQSLKKVPILSMDRKSKNPNQTFKLSFLPFSQQSNSKVYVGEFHLPHARTGGVLIVAHRRLKHTDTVFNVVRQNRLHPRERVHFIRDSRKDTKQIHGGGGSLHSNSTPSSHCCTCSYCNGSKAAAIAALSFSPLSCTHSRFLSTLCSQQDMPLYRQIWSTWRGQ
jgi:hypothetical protein